MYLYLMVCIYIHIIMPVRFKTIGPETVHACLIRLIGISGSRSSSQSWIHCGLKNNNNNNNKELQRKKAKGKAKKNPTQPCYNTRRVIYILFIYLFFLPHYVRHLKWIALKISSFSQRSAAKVFTLLSCPPTHPVSPNRPRPLFIYIQHSPHTGTRTSGL